MIRITSSLVLLLGLPAGSAALAAPETAGVGLALSKDGQHLVIHAILPDSPAAASRALHVGDRILAVAQGAQPAVSVVGCSVADVVPLIRGPRGTTVQLTVAPSAPDDAKARVVILVRGTLKELSRWGDGVPLARGTRAPEIRMLRLVDRTSERLSEHSGKVVVLEFWSTTCAPCQAVVAALQRYPETYPAWADKVVLITASVDEDADVAIKHLAAKGWDKTRNAWVDSDALKAYHVNSIPTTYVIDRRGMIANGDQSEDVPTIVNRLLREE